jgi:hypothetical protein
MLLFNLAAVASAQTGQKDGANIVDTKPESAAQNSGTASPTATSSGSAGDLSDLKIEMKQLRMLVEQQQAEIAKLKGAGASSGESTGAQAAPAPAPIQQAIESAPESPVRPLKIGGFANWAYGKTNNVNEFDLATQHGRYDNIDAGVIISLGITPNVTATTQFSFQTADDETSTDVDFAFLDWKVNDKFRLRAGQVKNPFGLYSEYQGIGTVYPFNDTPQSIYGGTGIASEFYRGIGASGTAFTTKKWEMTYDFFFGGVLVDEIGTAEITRDAILNGEPTAQILPSSEEIRQTLGGRLTLSRPDSGFKFGVNGNSGISPDKGRHTVVGAFAAYDTAKWLLHSEFASSFEPGFIHYNAAYVEAGYKIVSHWQPVFRYDWSRQGIASSAVVPDQLLSHREVAGGLNYWVSPKALLKFSYHHVDGNMLSVPRGTFDINALAFNAIPKTTNLATFGVAFIF